MKETIESKPRRSELRITGLLCVAAVCMLAALSPAVSNVRAATDSGTQNAQSVTKERAAEKITIRPDATVLLEIRSIAEATGEQALSDALVRIRHIVEGAHDRLVSQLLLFVSEPPGDAKAKAVVALILKRLNVPQAAAVAALVPHLDHNDAAIRATVRALLRGYEDRSATRPPDFSSYRAIVEVAVRAGEEPSPALVRFMYASDPGAALLAMMRGHQLRQPADIKPLLWGQHRVAEMLWKRRYGFIEPKEVEPEAARQLETLSRHDRWWVRLYAAEMCRRHVEFRSPEILARLATDAHPLVREAILAAEPERSQN